MSASAASFQQSVDECQGLVRSLALKIHRGLPRRVELDDLIGYGQVGLVEAAREFDPARGRASPPSPTTGSAARSTMGWPR